MLYQCCSGFCIDLLRLISEKIGFDFELFQVPDKKWGAFDKVKTRYDLSRIKLLEARLKKLVGQHLSIFPRTTNKVFSMFPKM